MTTYCIVRIIYDPVSRKLTRHVLKTEQSVMDAVRHCMDIETSSSTCLTSSARDYHDRHGDFFDIYEPEEAARG